jgi:hypothetical protein
MESAIMIVVAALLKPMTSKMTSLRKKNLDMNFVSMSSSVVHEGTLLNEHTRVKNASDVAIAIDNRTM